jgi:hypothetical protein
MHYLLVCGPCSVVYLIAGTNRMHYLLVCGPCSVVICIAGTNRMHYLLVCGPRSVVYLYSRNQQDALFTFSFIPINNLCMFRVGLLLIIRRYCIYSNWYMSCVYVDWLLTGVPLRSTSYYTDSQHCPLNHPQYSLLQIRDDQLSHSHKLI